MRIVEVRSIGHRFPSNRCCLACALTEKGRTLFEKRYRASSWSRNYRSRDCRWCNVYVKRARRPRRTSRPCCHCVLHRNTVRCRRRVHRCWRVACWLPCVFVNVSLVAVVVVDVSARRRRVRRCRCSSPSRSSLSSLLMRPLVAVVSANAVSLAVKTQRLYQNENTSVVTSEMKAVMERTKL